VASERFDAASTVIAELGLPIAEFKVGMAKVLLFWIFGLLACSVALAALGLGIWLIFFAENALKGHGMNRGTWKLGLLLIVSAAAGVGAIRQARRSAGTAVLIFAEAVAQVQRERAAMLHWKAISTVRRLANPDRQLQLSRGTYRLIVEGAGGEQIEFNQNVARFGELAGLILEQTVQHLLPRAEAAFRSGGTLEFGDVSVSNNALHYQKAVVPWENLREAKIVKGMFTVYAEGAKKPVLRVPVTQVANYHVLISMIKSSRAAG
jgi:hypothetical protein